MAAAIEKGIVRLVFTDANQSYEEIVWEGRTEAFLKADGSTVQEMEQNPTCFKTAKSIGEDDLLIIKEKPDAADTLVIGSSNVTIPITRRNLTSGIAWEDVLVASQFTAPGSAGDAPTGVFSEVARYTIPAQQRLKLGHVIADARVDSKLRVIVYDDTA